jgi:ubiquitin C-terminal hydrolase
MLSVYGTRAQELNKENPLGLRGELAEAFGSLMHALWKESAAVVQPRSFKSKLSSFAPNFSGYSQQDSQVREKSQFRLRASPARLGLTAELSNANGWSMFRRRWLRC